MVGVIDSVEALARTIDLRQVAITLADRYYAGEQPMAFLAPAQRRALGDRLGSVGANYVRLATDALAERLDVDGFTVAGQPLADLWALWRAQGMQRAASVAILEALVLGQAYVTVWADDTGAPVLTVDSPREMAITRHPLTRQVRTALKRWRDLDGTARAVFYDADAVRLLTGPSVPEGGAMPTTGWSVAETLPNPLGLAPVVALTNSSRLLDDSGAPEARPIWGLTDALGKVLADVLVASESASMPRRWATGLAVEDDDQGRPVNPFADVGPGSILQSEDPQTRFGNFAEPTLGGYDSVVTMLLRQIGAISGLPDHLMGFAGSEPSSAEQIRAAESALVSRAYSHQATFGEPFARVAALAEAIRTGSAVRSDVVTVWRSPESQTVAQSADAAAKVVAAGLLSVEGAQARYLGLTPEEIAAERRAILRATIDRAPLAIAQQQPAQSPEEAA